MLGRLSPEDGAAFEDHYMTCATCAAAVEEADAYVRAIWTAAADMRNLPCFILLGWVSATSISPLTVVLHSRG